MTMVEKIIARHAFVSAGKIGVEAVKPGDALFAVADVRFSHEYVTPMAESLFKQALGNDARVTEPESVYAFRDHLTFLGRVMPEEKRKLGLLERADGLAITQERFTEKQGIRLYGESPDGGSEAICHNAVVEDLALPGQIVIGTDSHTCMAGVLGCFAFGVGSTDMANAWYTKDVRIRVPETVRYVLKGKKRADVAAKDVMLVILASEYMKTSKGIGKVLEFAGEDLKNWAMDERATLTNMSVEAGGTTGIIEPDEVTLEYIVRARGLDAEEVRQGFTYSDPDAEYAAVFEIDLDEIRPMVALPGDPRNGIPIDELGEEVRIDAAYGGSCTGGKMADMDMYAEVLQNALAQGKRVAPGVHLYLQFGSQKIKQYARERGYLEIFEKVGAELIDPSCGACINAGPGASPNAETVTVSAQNRNFPGRSGPGKLYLASPYVVAASAIAGKIVEPYEFLREPEPELIEVSGELAKHPTTTKLRERHEVRALGDSQIVLVDQLADWNSCCADTKPMGVAKLTDQNTIVPESKYARIERERRYLLQDLPEGIDACRSARTDHRQLHHRHTPALAQGARPQNK